MALFFVSNKRVIPVDAAFLVIAILFCGVAWAQEPLITDTEQVELSPKEAEFRIHFAEPLQYINHTPETRGKDIQIQLRPLRGLPALASGFLEQQSLVPGSSEVRQVEYELDTASGFVSIRIRLKNVLNFRIQPSRDYRQIILFIEQPATSRDASEPDQSGVVAPRREAAPGTPGEPSEADSGVSAEPAVGGYVVNLQSTIDPPNLAEIQLDAPFRKNNLYITAIELDGKRWHRLRLGFFDRYADAVSARQALMERYHGAWVSQATGAELAGVTGRPEPAPAISAKKPRPEVEEQPAVELLPAIPETEVAEIMESARQAMAGNDYSRAIQLYTKVLRYPEHKYREQAQEFLGLARERNKQLAHAKREYEKYLVLYPEGEGAERVRQRLAALVTARKEPQVALKPGRRAQPE
ncbi:tetratricopeptide repeat protein [Sedimenticola selenatireducens]|uniref:Uncharacterized protein n=1 Tax=Sedimenticola selenatireducens TaxID=191960 RepID=A0A2N6CSN7_9GAMM|nr:outer membrane protein assembly factor BamD [Sedimenticola selenatireducens]PLX60136.1 MAG: hypothetical protein C0630_16565 [Sedimenticola selenatireducens]